MMRNVMPLTSPFGAEPLREIPLPHAPLVRVLAQVKFPEIASVTRRDFIGPFQEAIRSDYPVLREERGVMLTIGPEGVAQTAGEHIWRFHSADGLWRVSAAPTFMAIETDGYESRADFFDRFDQVVRAAAEHFKPVFWERLGVRYVDRIEGDEMLGQLGRLVKPEVLGLGTASTAELQTLLTQSQFGLADDVQLVARTGIMPPGATLDPTIAAAVGRSWTLDIDVSITTQSADFDPETLRAKGEDLASRAYRFFRWSVTDDFLLLFGATEDDIKEVAA
jgi:uncharacterized protein (TIGR04255 family)